MAADQRRKNVSWSVGNAKDGGVETWEAAGVAVLMDIRDELQALNRLLACPNFLGIPHTLTKIKQNTTKPRKRRKAAK